jgi:metal-responsive CopG/Arc/MetJ family transcriptional regulator
MSTKTTERTDDGRTEKEIVSFQLTTEKREELDRRAEQQGTNRSEIIRSLISDGLDEGSA